MAIDAVASVGGSSSSGASGLSALSTDEFTRLIFAELSNQDPLSPNDTNQLLQQISTIRSIQSEIDLSESLGSLVSQNEFANAAGLVGRQVSGVSEDRFRVEGIVRSVSRTSAGSVVTLEDGTRISVDDLDEVGDFAAIPGTTPTTRTTSIGGEG